MASKTADINTRYFRYKWGGKRGLFKNKKQKNSMGGGKIELEEKYQHSYLYT